MFTSCEIIGWLWRYGVWLLISLYSLNNNVYGTSVNDCTLWFFIKVPRRPWAKLRTFVCLDRKLDTSEKTSVCIGQHTRKRFSPDAICVVHFVSQLDEIYITLIQTCPKLVFTPGVLTFYGTVAIKC